MIGWKARAYLNVDVVKIEKESLLTSFFRRPSGQTDVVKQLDFPYAHGTTIQTLYGEAEVTQPLPSKHRGDGTKNDAEFLSQKIGLSITAWTLADSSHPTLYCTVKTAQIWKESRGAKTPDGLFSAFGTLVSTTLDFAGQFLTTTIAKEEGPHPVKFERYYANLASVSTAFGTGRIQEFCENNGFYKISLTSWGLVNGSHPTAWLRGVDIRYAIAKGCQEGHPVLTSLGLSGILESVQPTTGKYGSSSTT